MFKIFLNRKFLASTSLLAGLSAFTLPALADYPSPQRYPSKSGYISTSISYDSDLITDSMSQVNSVSQLTDVTAGSWAYEALRSLVERYGCIAGYRDKTFLGSKPLNRYEFAAALNSCAQAIERLVQENAAVTKEDIDKLKALQKDFQAELVAISAKVDNLEDRVSFLEGHQFSTTTKLHGFITMNLFGTANGGNKTATVFQDTVYLAVSTSFTGHDLLFTSFASSTATIPNYTSFNDGRDFGNIASTREGLTIGTYGGDTGNLVYQFSSEYIFPLIETKTDRVLVTLAANSGFNTSQFLLPRNGVGWQGTDAGNGAISTFAQRNPLYRLGGGTGGLINYVNDNWEITGGYLAMNGYSPTNGGLFNGNYLALGQINYTPTPDFSIALAYRNNYFGPGQFAWNNQYQYVKYQPGFLGTGLANTFADKGIFFDQDVAVVSNTYGVQAFYQVNPGFVIGGFGAKISATLLGRGVAQEWTYSLNLAFPDLGKEGNLGGIVIGVEPMLTGLIVGGQYVGGFKNDVGMHIEAFYRYSFNDGLSITPGLIWITSPNQDSSNPSILVGVLRTTFSF